LQYLYIAGFFFFLRLLPRNLIAFTSRSPSDFDKYFGRRAKITTFRGLIKRRNYGNFKELGLVNSRELFKNAFKGGYAVPAFNFNNLEQMQAIISACGRDKISVILQVSKGGS